MLLGYHRLRMPYLITRRSFGKLLAAVPLARAFAPLARASSENRNMFLSLNSVLLQGRVHWPEFARLAAQTGFPGTDIMLRPAMEAGASATNQRLAGLKIRPAVIEFPVEFRKDDATFKASLTQLDAAAQFAAAIHCPRMMTYIMPSSDTPKDELRQTYKQRFTESARILARDNVRLGLEFLGPLELRKMFKYEFIWHMNDMLAFAKEVVVPTSDCCSIPGTGTTRGATPEDIIAACCDRIVHVHFNDSPNLPPEQIHDNQRLLPGEGAHQLDRLLAGAAKHPLQRCAQRRSLRANERHDTGSSRESRPR